MFAKIKPNGELMAAPNPLKIVIANPSQEQYMAWGWLPVIETEPPSYNPDTQYLDVHYEQETDRIVQVWEVRERINAED